MENRSHALLAGLFTIALLVAAVLVAIWMSRGQGDLLHYELRTDTSVTGLSSQSAINYQGVPVGKVLALSLDINRPGNVRIQIGIRPGTPITTSTWAELTAQGVTGMSFVSLHDDGSSTEMLVPKPGGEPIMIPLKPGLLARVEARASVILASVERIASQVEKVLDDRHVRALGQTLDNLDAITASLRPAMEQAGPLVQSLRGVAAQADRMARDMSEAVLSARSALDRVLAPGGPLYTATQSMEDLARVAAQLRMQTLPTLGTAAGQVGSAAASLGNTARVIGESPQSLLFGPPAVRPGPGESGFQGFGGNQ